LKSPGKPGFFNIFHTLPTRLPTGYPQVVHIFGAGAKPLKDAGNLLIMNNLTNQAHMSFSILYTFSHIQRVNKTHTLSTAAGKGAGIERMRV
jgi:hypothetical protein